jgi:hypothetical protein
MYPPKDATGTLAELRNPALLEAGLFESKIRIRYACVHLGRFTKEISRHWELGRTTTRPDFIDCFCISLQRCHLHYSGAVFQLRKLYYEKKHLNATVPSLNIKMTLAWWLWLSSDRSLI